MHMYHQHLQRALINIFRSMANLLSHGVLCRFFVQSGVKNCRYSWALCNSYSIKYSFDTMTITFNSSHQQSTSQRLIIQHQNIKIKSHNHNGLFDYSKKYWKMNLKKSFELGKKVQLPKFTNSLGSTWLRGQKHLTQNKDPRSLVQTPAIPAIFQPGIAKNQLGTLSQGNSNLEWP